MASNSASSDATLTSGKPPGAVSFASVEEKNHKIKLIQFLGRTTPIILQNENGPCPLLAICNVLLLKNQLNVSSDIPEISQENLLSLVAERLLDSNCNINNKYAENQQQNISDAIDLLPRLATGIDVNIRFTRIDDFEFTRECAIFDLMDIPLYHGWIVDPQDHDTALVIGSKSYNTLAEELVAFDTRDTEAGCKENSEEECVDFAAATTATLGVPTPCLSRGRSFDDPPLIDSDLPKMRKGDIAEEAELQSVLNLSVFDASTSSKDNAVSESQPVSLVETLEQSGANESLNHRLLESSTSDNSIDLIDLDNEVEDSSEDPLTQTSGESEDHAIVQETSVHDHKQVTPASEIVCSESSLIQCETPDKSNLPVTTSDADLPTGKSPSRCETEGLIPSVVGSEPIYEGEEIIIESETIVNPSKEPMYEGEVILAEQCVKGFKEACDGKKEEITQKEGELLRNFLMNNVHAQLTIYGLFRLRDDLKERELCVFFRNNHFNTMFKLEGELYILATDQGFLNQPGLVWEKLNEVNGNTMYMTWDFKEFNGEDHNTAWDEQIARETTAEFLANSADDLRLDADMKLARDLQQQEYDQNPQPQSQPEAQQQRQNPLQHQSAANSRLIVGPQAPRSRKLSHKETKGSKEKCRIM